MYWKIYNTESSFNRSTRHTARQPEMRSRALPNFERLDDAVEVIKKYHKQGSWVIRGIDKRIAPGKDSEVD